MAFTTGCSSKVSWNRNELNLDEMMLRVDEMVSCDFVVITLDRTTVEIQSDV